MAVAKKYTQLKNKRINLREAIPLDKPFTILFEPASICNFKCLCCFHSEPDIYSFLPKGSMKFEKFRKIADDLANWEGDKIKVIRIIGFGEPLVNPETPRMVKYLKKLEITERIEITTNASLLNYKISQQLIDSSLDYIRCSIYSMDQKRHEKQTQSRINIKTIKNNIVKLKDLRDSIGKSNPFIYVKMLKSQNDSENEQFLSEYSAIADEVALEKPHNWLEDSSGSDRNIRNVCPQPFKMLSIHYNGDVILCDPDWKGHTKVGNALSENIASIWGGNKIQEFWKMQLENRRHENESCRNCSFLVDEYAIDNLDGVSSDILNERISL